MENIFIALLPPWIETGLQPAFYDKESGTVLQQTARMYAKVNELIASYNNFTEDINDTVNDYINQFNELHDYVYNYFDNLDVQEEIDNKIDKMVANGTFQEILNAYIQPKLDGLDAKIDAETADREASDNELHGLITAIGNGTPLTASSVDDMTDTTKVYVNTTDGKWYYYDGDSWEIGGTFQSAVIGEDTVEPYMTKFMATKNLLPYTNWVEGKVWSWTNGSEMTYNSGCLNTATVSVTGGEVLLIINDNTMQLNEISIVEYDENDDFVKSTLCGYQYNSRIEIDENTTYIKFCSRYNKFSTLPVNSMQVIRLTDVPEIINFNNVFDYSSGTKPNITTQDVIIANKYGHKLIPRLYRTTHIALDISKLKYPNPYIFQYSGLVSGTASTVTPLLGTYVYADNVTTDDYLYVDYSNSTVKPTYVNTFVGATGQGYMTKVDDVKGIWRIKLTDGLIAGLNAGNMFFYGQYTNYPTGETLTADVHCYINEDYTDLVRMIEEKEAPEPIKMIFLGDSITHLGGDRSWTDKFNTIINGTTIANVAVDGARLRDFPTTEYDGNPTQANPSSNVLGNQVQKILNNDYEAPDAIIIAIGTNGGISLNEGELQDAFFTNSGVKDITAVDREVDAGAYRWCTQKLNEKYPKAKIIWCTPIQGAYANNKRPNVVGPWGDNLKEFCLWGSTYCFDTEKCGINTLNASVNLYDGLHPDVAGAKLIAQYNAGEFMKLIDVIRNS